MRPSKAQAKGVAGHIGLAVLTGVTMAFVMWILRHAPFTPDDL